MNGHKCYLAGPMRKHENFNFPLFNKVANILEKAGWWVLNPAQMDYNANEPWCVDGDPDKADVSYPLSEAEVRSLIRRDTNAIMSLRPNFDSVILLPDWRTSTGSVAEAALGRWLGLGIKEYVEGTYDEGQQLLYHSKFGVETTNWYRLDDVTEIGDQ